MGQDMQTDSQESKDDLAAKIIDTALYVLQARQFADNQQNPLLSFLEEKVGLSKEKAHQALHQELHPKYRNVLSFVERKAFESALLKQSSLALLEEATQDEDVVEDILDKYLANWSPDSLRSFMKDYGQELSLSLIEMLLLMIENEMVIENRQMQLIRVHQVSQMIGIDKWLTSAFFYKHGFFSSASNGVFSTEGDDMILLGSGGACDLVLFDPRVEPLHAYIQNEHGNLVLQAEQSKRPVWYQDKQCKRLQLKEGDQFQIGPCELTLKHTDLFVKDPDAMATLSIKNINREIYDRKKGQSISLLNDVNVTIFGGELIALIGPSGCGKTTLMNAINGVAPADSGDVLFNGDNFHQLLVKDRSLVGIVPQDDLVLPELTVRESLYYSGLLRLPPTTPPEDIDKEVDRVLQELGIEHIQDSLIGDTLKRGISGGQRKRVNLGQELLSRTTKILFLDEPTSGLDPRASQDIVKLARGLADKGRIIFLVTHDLTDGIINQVDNLLTMVKGGKLAFFGEQREALDFFNVGTTDKIFQRFGDDQGKWPVRYKERVDYNLRQVAIDKFSLQADSAPELPPKVSPFVRFWRQYSTLTTRYCKVKLRDKAAMLVIALQPPVLALVMWTVFRDTENPLPTQAMIFVLSLSTQWFGMSAAVRELIADQVIFRRERRVGVGTFPYVMSKVSVLGVIVAIQACFLSGVMYFSMDMATYEFSLPALLGVSVLTAWVGMGLGLFISSLYRSSEAAVSTLPIILIPQIAFSSLLFAIRDMTWLSKAITWLMPTRYTFDAFLKCGEDIAVRTRRGEFEPQPVNGTLWRLGLKTTDKADDIGLLLSELCLIMVGLTLFLLVCTWIRIWYRTKD